MTDADFVVTDMTGGADASTINEIRDAFIAAVTGAPTLAITASADGTGRVALVNDAIGEAGNVDIIETVAAEAFAFEGMAGGSTETTSTDTCLYAGAALASGTGLTLKLLGAEVIQSLEMKVNLERGLRLHMVIAAEGQLP